MFVAEYSPADIDLKQISVSLDPKTEYACIHVNYRSESNLDFQSLSRERSSSFRLLFSISFLLTLVYLFRTSSFALKYCFRLRRFKSLGTRISDAAGFVVSCQLR